MGIIRLKAEIVFSDKKRDKPIIKSKRMKIIHGQNIKMKK